MEISYSNVVGWKETSYSLHQSPHSWRFRTALAPIFTRCALSAVPFGRHDVSALAVCVWLRSAPGIGIDELREETPVRPERCGIAALGP